MIGTVKYFVAKDSSASRGTPGEVKRVAFEPWQNVKKRQPVYATDQFRTGRKSRLKILFSDNSLMALGPGAEMTVTAYRTQPESKFRQGVVDVKRGLVMYIVNKSQNHKKSFLNIITPTANIGARGTQGYIASSDKKTLVANQAGAVGVKSSDPDIDVQVNVGSMMKTVVRAGAPPVTPRPLSENELATFRNFVVGDLAFSGGSKNALISVDEVKEEEEEDEEEKEGDEKGEPGEDGEGEGKEGEEGEEGEEGNLFGISRLFLRLRPLGHRHPVPPGSAPGFGRAHIPAVSGGTRQIPPVHRLYHNPPLPEGQIFGPPQKSGPGPAGLASGPRFSSQGKFSPRESSVPRPRGNF